VPELQRLRRRAEFLKVAASGRKWVTPGLIVQVDNPPPLDRPDAVRYGLTASRKVGGAVERNRARRRLRAVASEVLPARALAGRAYVLIARRGTLTRPHAALVNDLESALRRLGERGA
jgi:ribonuclease P protein component